MEQKQNRFAPEAAVGDPAFFTHVHVPESATAAGPPPFAEPPLLSDCLGDPLDEALAETFPPGSRKPRHDGFTPEAIGGFLRHLAATGVVESAARAVGLSAQAAYAFRNARRGRAFAKMWDAVLIHRSRARIASEVQARSIAGCVSIRKRDGVVVGEYHYYDNRLAMSALARLDRLAEKAEASGAHLRTLSEDLDDYIECIAEGGDPDAFVEERRPPEPDPEPAVAALGDEALMRLIELRRAEDENDDEEIAPEDVEVRDLDPSQRASWTDEQWSRARQSGLLQWLAMNCDPAHAPGRGDLARFEVSRLAALAAWDAPAPSGGPAKEGAPSDDDLDPDAILDWTGNQLACGWRSGLIQRLPQEFWERLAAAPFFVGDEE